MSLDTVAVPVQFSTNGSTTAFSFPYRFLEQSDLKVILRDDSSGAETDLVLNVDYTISAVNNDYSSGATVTTTATYASGYTLQIERLVDDKQETEYTEGDAFPASTTETALDKLAMQHQQQKQSLLRAIRAPETESLAEMPNSINRASKYLGFGVNGDPIAQASLPAASDISNLKLGSSYASLNAALAKIARVGKTQGVFSQNEIDKVGQALGEAVDAAAGTLSSAEDPRTFTFGMSVPEEVRPVGPDSLPAATEAEPQDFEAGGI